ncbi:hypothetical protein [Bradyrhizobium algeriense]|uniref:hypothetical protein n=1 Tax=Bradyrhizobium algeriense TaxID=634784 RepID=UPI000D3991C8|nr:hypothetical protein [Bradyrhizobium algeriense]
MRTYSGPVLATASGHSISGFGPIGEIMAVKRHGPDAQGDTARSLLERVIESLYARRSAVEDLRLSRSLAGALVRALCGEGAS